MVIVPSVYAEYSRMPPPLSIFVQATRWVLVVAIANSLSCHASLSPSSPLPTGSWGGDHVAMTVMDSSTHIELDCAHADITGAFRIDARGQFDRTGTFVREHGEIRLGEPPDSHQASFAGSVVSTTMALTIRLTDTDGVIGNFTLSRGNPGRVFKCL